MLVVYDFTNISQFKIIPPKSASKYGECVDFPQFFSQITTIEIVGKKEERVVVSLSKHLETEEWLGKTNIVSVLM